MDDDDEEEGPRPQSLLDRLNKRGGRRRPPPLRTTIPIAKIRPPGYGPFWVFLLVNVDEDGDSKKQTEVRLDSDPLLVQVWFLSRVPRVSPPSASP